MRPHTPRTLLRLTGGGAACAIVAVAVGLAIGQARFGRSDAETFARVERDVRVRIAQIALSLRSAAQRLAANPARIQSGQEDEEAVRALFDEADAAARATGDPDIAVTLYGANGAPLAWSGRSSELPRERVAGPASLFVAPGPLGLLLVATEPVIDQAAAGHRRLGTVVAERLLSPRRGVGAAPADAFSFATDLAPVALRPRYAGVGERSDPLTFLVTATSGEALVEARVAPADLAAGRQAWRFRVLVVALVILVTTGLLLTWHLLDMRARARTTRRYTEYTASVAAVLVASRLLLLVGSGDGTASDALGAIPLFGSLAWFARAPLDFMLSGLAGLAVVILASDTAERWRMAGRRSRRPVRPLSQSILRFASAQFVAGAIVSVLAFLYQRFLGSTVGATAFDVLRFSFQPWDPSRLWLAAGLLFCHAAVFWASVLILRLGLARWRYRWSDPIVAVAVAAAWAVPMIGLLLLGAAGTVPVSWGSSALAVGAVAVTAFWARRGITRHRHASQAVRLVLMFLALVLPALVMYPTLVDFADHAARRTIESTLGPEAINQREVLQVRLKRSLDQIDRTPALEDLIAAASPDPLTSAPSTDAAFFIWAQTDLAAFRLASAVELYGPNGSLVSRFALNLPEYTINPQNWQEDSCGWEFFGEISPFGSVERRLLHAGRKICRETRGRLQVAGTVVVHVILDYDTLPFISSQNPYLELFRTRERIHPNELPGRDLVFVVYGWGRLPTYASGVTPWPLDEGLFSRIYASRIPFWTKVVSGRREYVVYVQNDRFGIYALGYPRISVTGHLVNGAELVTLVGAVYVTLLILATAASWLAGRRTTSGRALLREIRASFYRKLFLAFVAAALIPVLTLAVVTRAYIAARLQAEFSAAALRTTAVAQRVIEDYGTLQAGGPRTLMTLDDDVMVWISRVVSQDVNIFSGSRLVATSKRDLFASGLLPTRTPADVYRAIVLQRLANVITEERADEFSYMLAAAPIRAGEHMAVLTVPLTLRQQESRRELDDLTRRLVLATVFFILVGAAIGYSMAERIADPVNRLTRATRRIARGDLDARIAASSSDELRRLVEAFNTMAEDLRRQRDQLERTHRLEAWAEMARQVAHEIKNPLTPIQLSAEHLRRVHVDRGRPLDPVLDECVDTILSQVRLLRQISAEFSSFASSPTPRPELTSLASLVEEIVHPYRMGTGERIAVTVDVPTSLPPVSVDRTLLGRALTNVIENALHAMPGQGVLTIRATLEERETTTIRLTVADSGVGMDEQARQRVFEPYFSTKTTGTGLGLTIAKRNIELSGGTIDVRSTEGIGTVVGIQLPVPRADDRLRDGRPVA